jgi:hypothetical protein
MTRRRLAMSAAVAGLCAVVAARLLLIHVSLPEITYWEEPYRLTIASELLAGPRLPLTEYQADNYQGGSLAIGVLAAPLVAILGPSYETLKLAPLAFTAATAALWTMLLWRAAGPVAGALGAWLFVLAPPLAQVYQVHAMGSHAETALFAAAAFALTLASVRSQPSRGLPFLLGLVGGFGIWFCYTTATSLAACGVVWLWASPRGSVRKGLVPLLLGAMVGLLPWLAYNLAHGFHGFDRLTELFDATQHNPNAGTEPLRERIGALLFLDLPLAFGFPVDVPGTPSPSDWMAYVFAVAAVFGVAAIALQAVCGAAANVSSREGRFASSPDGALAALIATAIVVHLLTYLATSFRLDVENGFIAYRFFAPLHPLLVGAFALVSARLAAAGRRRIAFTGAILALALGGYGVAAMLTERPARELPPLDFGYKVMGLLTQLKYRREVPQAIELLSHLEGQERQRAFFGLGWGLEFQYEKDGDWPSVALAIGGCPRSDDRSATVDGLRWSARQREVQSRTYADTGFRVDESRAVHGRIVALESHLPSMLRLAESAAVPADSVR